MAADHMSDTKTRLLRIDSDEWTLRPVRALLLSAEGELGGAERSFLEVLKALPRDKVAPEVCVPPGCPLSRLCLQAGVRVHDVPYRRFRRTTNIFVLGGQVWALYRGAQRVAAICRESGAEVIHANTDTAALVAWEASRMTGVPFIWHCRDMCPMHGFASVLSASAAAVVAISGAVEQHLLKERAQAEKIRRVDNGVDLARFCALDQRAAIRARTREKLGIANDRPVVLSIGAYVPWKKHELFLEALALLREQWPSVLGLLAGSSHISGNTAYAESLWDYAGKLALHEGDALRLLEQREDIPELLAAADLLVSCSENEPFGRVLAEAGAAGLPVVSTRSGAKSEIVEDNATGVLTEPGLAGPIAAACAGLLADQPRRAEMGRLARARVEKYFDVRRAAAELAALFETVAARR